MINLKTVLLIFILCFIMYMLIFISIDHYYNQQIQWLENIILALISSILPTIAASLELNQY